MVYSIVIFTKENSVSAVPSCWYDALLGKCAWPKPGVHSSASINKLISRRTPYNTIEFDLFKARQLKRNFASLSEAQSKLNTATVTSDISEYENSSKKKRKNKRSKEIVSSNNSFKKIKEKAIEIEPPQYSSNSKSSESELDDSDKDISYEPLTKSRSTSPVVKSNHSTSSFMTQKNNKSLFNINIEKLQEDSSDDSDNDVSYEPGTKSLSSDKSITGSGASSVVKLTPSTSSFMTPNNNKSLFNVNKLLEDSSNSPIDGIGILQPEQVLQHNDTNNDGLMGVIKTLGHKLDSIEKQIAGLRYDHRLLFDVLDRIEHKIDTPNNVNSTSLQTFSENQSLINQPLIKTPISTEVELEAVEAKFISDQNHEFRSQLILEIKWSMGNDIKHSIKRIFEKFFNDELLCKYSFHGIRNKTSFSSLNICSTIFEAIRNETKFKNVQLKDIEDCVQKYLAQRPFVVKRKKAAIITNSEDDV